jgi:aspartate kinase
MKSHPGVASRTFSTLAELGIQPEIVTTSPIKIACYVPRGDVERAVKALHGAFELEAEGAVRAHD